MKNPLALKIFIIAGMTLLLLIPLSMVSDKIAERGNFLEAAANAVASSWTGPQTITGPVIALPYERLRTIKKYREKTGQYTEETQRLAGIAYLPLLSLTLRADTDNELRTRGIYKIPVFTSQITASGILDTGVIRERLSELSSGETIEYGTPFLFISISDSRGIDHISDLMFGGQQIAFQPGTSASTGPEGVHAILPDLKTLLANGTTEVAFNMVIRGMRTLAFVPTSLTTSVRLASDWPHPAFDGKFLPVTRTVTDTGYEASWNISAFASNVENQLRRCELGECAELESNGFGVSHIEAVNVYLMSERSVKYGILFLGLSFTLFFLYEILQQLPIHGIQYLLTGSAVSVFYLLLISLSEHLPFGLSYGIATAACVALLYGYLSAIVREKHHARVFSGFLTALYAILYVIITAEDFAFLMGGALTFMTLAALMLGTRKIDWYAVSETHLKRNGNLQDPATVS
ncbi:MAG: cell envelope integrity protein CreD [Pseudomonadales bacterium]|nr:cell envelope integrity protein CreD [Pseudomonadales bacterium]